MLGLGVRGDGVAIVVWTQCSFGGGGRGICGTMATEHSSSSAELKLLSSSAELESEILWGKYYYNNIQ